MIALSETTKIAFRALLVNKTRSALTMLGIVIGVMAVIMMFAIGAGANRQIAERFSSMGSNMIIVRPGASQGPGGVSGISSRNLTIEDAYAIGSECPAVAYAAPVSSGNAQVVYGNQNWSAPVTGTTPDYLFVRDWGLDSGHSFTEQDVRSAAKLAIIGKTVAENLFGNEDPVGKTIRVLRVPVVVVGVLGEMGESAFGRDEDNIILVPITTAQRRLFSTSRIGSVSSIMVKATGSGMLEAAQKQIEMLLEIRHRIRPGGEQDFSVRNMSQMIENAKSATRIMTLLLTAVASVSLLVGGIGIMNIMLVSVTERTREIGIRMALGARTVDIRLQFLVEAAALSMLGGFVGILLGITGSQVISRGFGWAVEISPFSVVLAFGFSALVGIFFGYFPAVKASMLNPIEALRYE
ncbi:MAG TPA: ABC transporter permease [Synergistales bacterium]|nr:ABC transporter permease [Synergistales bacterium]HRV70883.1 ABC transporter permease [Thermovirgaceae bacterium]